MSIESLIFNIPPSNLVYDLTVTPSLISCNISPLSNMNVEILITENDKIHIFVKVSQLIAVEWHRISTWNLFTCTCLESHRMDVWHSPSYLVTFWRRPRGGLTGGGALGAHAPPHFRGQKYFKVPFFILNFLWTRCPRRRCSPPHPHFLTCSSASVWTLLSCDWQKLFFFIRMS